MRRWSGVLVVMLLFSPLAEAEVTIDMQRIRMIESSGNPRAHNLRTDARGLYQITPICLQEWNNFHPNRQYTSEQLFSSRINSEIAHWYMNYRIPQMLRYYGKPDTIENRLICYNAGIAYVVRNMNLPRETRDYIKKYHSYN